MKSLILNPSRKTLVSAVLAAAALGAGMNAVAGGPFGWRYAPQGYYYQTQQRDRAEVEKQARAALDHAVKGEVWKSPRGITHIPLVNKDKLVIGNLWEEADLKAVEFGAYWTGRYGTKVELVSGGKVVGTLWLQ